MYETLARFVAAACGVALVLVVPRHLARWVGRRQRLDPRKFASIAAAVLVALVASDSVLRIVHNRHPPESELRWPPTRLDETGNLAPVPSTTNDVKFGTRTVRYAIDADGNRAARADQRVDPAAPTVLFAGESIAIGWGVAYERTYPALVAAALGVQSVNLAVTAFATDEAYLRVRDALPRFSDPLAVVMLVVPPELGRTVNPRRKRLALRGGELVSIAPSTSLLATSPLNELLPYHSDEAIPLTRAILRATADVARRRGAEALFVFTNFGAACLQDPDGSSRLERSLFEGLDAVHVRVDIPPAWTIAHPRDPHPNERGHAALANVIVRYLRDAARPKH